jgi:NAD(P)-dependent dehydrogenase (short-subunit alcohol dehydrogenase family)
MTAGGPLTGRVALVTGGGHGLGRAIALKIGGVGAAVAVCGRSPGPLNDTLDDLQRQGTDAIAVQCDVSDAADVEQMRQRLSEWKEPVDILVNNAGIVGPTANLADIDPEEWDAVMATNVRGVYLCCRAFLPAMIERRDGDIVNIASVSGKRPLPQRTPYCASKMAVIGLTTALAMEVGTLGVRVNTVSPGPLRSDRMVGVFKRDAAINGISIEEAERRFVSRGAVGRLLEEDEIADGVLAVLSVRGLTGADLDISGGMVAR